jgi:molybdenum cofactor guanylyltransferase
MQESPAGGLNPIAGWVLAGGLSTRLGRDKAFVEVDGEPLVGRTVRLVREVAGSAVVVGRASVFQAAGFEAIEEADPGNGPLGGILAALQATRSDWNLIVACDLARLERSFLDRLVAACTANVDAVVAWSPDSGRQPLCAVYHHRCREPLAEQYAAGVRAVRRAIEVLQVHEVAVTESEILFNLNTPDQLQQLGGRELAR